MSGAQSDGIAANEAQLLATSAHDVVASIDQLNSAAAAPRRADLVVCPALQARERRFILLGLFCGAAGV